MPFRYILRHVYSYFYTLSKAIGSWLHPEPSSQLALALPVEIIQLIIMYTAASRTGDPLVSLDRTSYQPKAPSKAAFNDLRALSCTSRAIRMEALAVWFQVLVVRTADDWNQILTMGICGHVTEIRILAPALVESVSSDILLQFPRLHTAFIDSHNDFVLNVPQEGTNLAQPVGYYRLVAPQLPKTLRRLWLTNAHGPDARVIQAVCKQCPHLKELWIERCTLFSPRVANEDGGSQDHHCIFWSYFPNDHDAYFAAVGVEEYSHSLALELAQLTDLEQLHMGLYLTPFEALEAHKVHHQEGRIREPLWESVCELCLDEYGDTTRAAEQRATEALTHNLPCLKQVSWASYCTPNKAGRSVYRLELGSEVAWAYQGSEPI